MANTDRRMPDMQDKIFFPKSIDGGATDESFFSGFKLAILGIAIFGNILNILYCLDNLSLSFIGKSIRIVTMLFIGQLVIRYIVFDERYYYNLYLRMRGSKVVKPSAFWGIVAFDDTSEGCVVTFKDLKVGVYAKLHRDSITGRQLNIREVHYDAISDFYAAINKNGLAIQKLDLMEPVGNDPRLLELDKLIENSSHNKNLKDLVEKQVSYTKYLTRVNMYESEYVLIHSIDYNDKGMKLLQKAEDALQELLSGCYSGYTILDKSDIDELVKENYGIRLFDSNKATVELFKQSSNYRKAINIVAVGYKDGHIEEINSGKVQTVDKAKNSTLKGKESKLNRLSPKPTEIEDGCALDDIEIEIDIDITEDE